MQLTYDITIMPLLALFIIMLCLTMLTVRMYLKTNIRTDLFLAISFAVITIIPLTLYWKTGEQAFWSKPFHLALLTVLCVTLVIYWLGEKRSLAERIPYTVLTVLVAITFILPSSFLVAIILGFSLFVTAIYLYVNAVRGGKVENVRLVLYVILGISIVIGGILSTNAFAMIYSLALLCLMLYEMIRYTDRLIGLLKNVGTYSMTDPLTRVYNKGYLLKKSAQLVEKQAISVIFGDIDSFKKLNDTKGHEYGDEVLIKVAAVFKNVLLKKQGTAFRYGGEELVGIVIADLEDTAKLAEQFRVAVEKEVGVTISLGVANSEEISKSYRPRLELDTIKLADERMYISKKTGKNKVTSRGE